MKRLTAVLAVLLVVVGGEVRSESNIDPVQSFGWSENGGWINFLGDSANGVVVARTRLSGYAWSENFGWIFLGSGAPASGTTYSQAAGDTGVNRDQATGFLSGFAWGENIGWVNFDTEIAGADRAAVDGSGHFTGYAWGENVGWINLASGFGVVATSVAGPEDWTVY